jgi:hypothetical protein
LGRRKTSPGDLGLASVATSPNEDVRHGDF